MDDIEIPKWLQGLPMAPEFHPTETEFADPIAYISKIEKQASAFGICKIIPPLPKPSKRYVLYNLNKSLSKCPELGSRSDSSPQTGSGPAVFTTRHQELGHCMKKFKGSVPVRQSVVHKQVWQSGEVYTLDQFESKSKIFAKNHLGNVAKDVAPLVIESLFWKSAYEKPIYLEYANDVPGSGFGVPEGSVRCLHKRNRKRKREFNRNQRGSVSSKKHEVSTVQVSRPLTKDEVSVKNDTGGGGDMEGTAGWKLSNSPWNLQVIARSPGSLTRFMTDEVPGVTSPMVYIGMLFSWFAWHVEDHELHSLNFLHMGSPKTWYAAPGDYAFALEEVIRVQGYGGNLDLLAALTVLGEKTTLLSPEVVVASGIPCCRLVQNPGDFVVTFPRAYHVGFSHGFNCGEAANFATPQWLKVAKEAAVRRAAMNYLPMLSHQQLLYMLTMSFVSRIPRALLPGVRSSRLRDRKKEEREILIKKAFIEDMINEDSLLHTLLGKESISYVVLWEPELLPSQNNMTQPLSLPPSLESSSALPDEIYPKKIQCELFVEKDDSCIENDLHDATAHFTNIQTGDISSVDSKDDNSRSNKVDRGGSYMDDDDDDFPYGLNVDSGTLTCVGCGVLGFPFMSIVQPSDKAAKELFPTYEVIQDVVGNIDSMKPPKISHLDDTVNESDSGTIESTGVYFEAQGVMDEHQTRNRGHISFTEALKFERDTKLLETVPERKIASEESSPVISEVVANKEPKEPAQLQSQMGASSIGVGNQYPLQCNDPDSPVHNLLRVPNDMPINSTVKCAVLMDMLDVESGECLRAEVEAGVKTDLRSKTNFAMKPWKTCNGFLRPRIFCLEHALEVEELLHCKGGANVLIICHSDYPKIRAEAMSIAEDIGAQFNCGEIPFESASQQDLNLINISIDDEDFDECGEDWTSKLCLNLQYCVKLRKLSSSKQERHALHLGGIFSDIATFSGFPSLKWQSKKSRTQTKATGLINSKFRENAQKKDDPISGNLESGLCTETDPILVAQVRKPRGRPRKQWSREPSTRNESPSADDDLDSSSVKTVPDSRNLAEMLTVTKQIVEGSEMVQVMTCSNEKLGNDLAKLTNLPTITDHVKDSEAERAIPRKNEEEGCDSVKLTDICTVTIPDAEISVTGQVSTCSNDQTVMNPIAETSGMDLRLGYGATVMDPLPTVTNANAGNSEMEQLLPFDYEKMDECSEKLADLPTTVGSPITENSEVERMVPCVDEKTGNGSELSGSNTVTNTIMESSGMGQAMHCSIEKTEEIQMMLESNTMSDISDLAKPTVSETESEIHTTEDGNTPGKICSSHNALAAIHSKPTVFIQYKRKRAIGKKMEGQYGFDGFIRGPCEGLRPRTKKMACSVTVEEKKVIKKVTKKPYVSVVACRDSKNGGKWFHQCDIEGCRMSFTTRAELVMHKKNRCTYKGCGKRFSSHKYAVHHNRVHSDERPLKCPWKGCEMSFKWAWARTEHIRAHTGERPYTCKVIGCGLTFRYVSDFSRHRRKTGHSPSNPL